MNTIVHLNFSWSHFFFCLVQFQLFFFLLSRSHAHSLSCVHTRSHFTLGWFCLNYFLFFCCCLCFAKSQCCGCCCRHTVSDSPADIILCACVCVCALYKAFGNFKEAKHQHGIAPHVLFDPHFQLCTHAQPFKFELPLADDQNESIFSLVDFEKHRNFSRKPSWEALIRFSMGF